MLIVTLRIIICPYLIGDKQCILSKQDEGNVIRNYHTSSLRKKLCDALTLLALQLLICSF